VPIVPVSGLLLWSLPVVWFVSAMELCWALASRILAHGNKLSNRSSKKKGNGVPWGKSELEKVEFKIGA
jgi:hypothetical protein